MTMHTFDFERLPQGTRIVGNIGDFDLAQARELNAAGVNGAYHVCCVREGVDTVDGV